MASLSQHIEKLLLHNDCVIVPGWGAVLCHYVPATFSDDGLTLVAPRRIVSFNGALTISDGLLASSIARAESISYDRAVAAIEREVAVMRHQLKADGEVALGRLGLFTAGSDGEDATFTPASGGIATARYACLPALPARRVIDLAREEASPAVEEAATIRPRRFVGRAVTVAASIALLVTVALSILVPVGNIAEKADVAALPSPVTALGTHKTEERAAAQPIELNIAMPAATLEATSTVDTLARSRYQRREIQRRLIADMMSETKMKRASAPKTVIAATAATPATQRPAAKASRINEHDTYCLIVSSHKSRAEADRFIASHGSASTMKVLEQDGKYRVYVATGSTSAEARANGAAAARKFKGSWVCPIK